MELPLSRRWSLLLTFEKLGDAGRAPAHIEQPCDCEFPPTSRRSKAEPELLLFS